MGHLLNLANSRYLFTFFLVFNLYGCLSSEEITEKSGFNEELEASTGEMVTHSGSTGDGPIMGATITYTDSRDKVISQSTSDDNASYSIDVPKTSKYPLLVTSSGGTDLVTELEPDFMLYSVALNPSDKTININPMSTAIVIVAREMGELNKKKLKDATQLVLSTFNFGLDTALVPNPILTKIDATNVTTVTASSDMFSEALRRTRNQLQNTESGLTIDTIMERLAHDLSDGSLDGRNNNGSDTKQLVDIFNIVSGEIIIELAAGEFTINGAPAISKIESVVKNLYPQSNPDLAGTVLNADMYAQLQQAVSTAAEYSQDPALSELQATVDAIPANSVISSTDLGNTSIATGALADATVVVASSGGTTPGILPVDVLPTAHNDSVTVEMNSVADVNVLSNDTGLDNGPVAIGIIDNPNAGTAGITADNQIQYTPKENFVGNDMVVYSITDSDGDLATASVNINVICSGTNCPTGSVSLSLSWNINPDNVDGYRVFFGDSASTATSLVSDTISTTAEFDGSQQLNLQTGDTACFRLKAYAGTSVSAASSAICTTI